MNKQGILFGICMLFLMLATCNCYDVIKSITDNEGILFLNEYGTEFEIINQETRNLTFERDIMGASYSDSLIRSKNSMNNSYGFGSKGYFLLGERNKKPVNKEFIMADSSQEANRR